MKKFITVLAFSALLLPALAQPAFAQNRSDYDRSSPDSGDHRSWNGTRRPGVQTDPAAAQPQVQDRTVTTTTQSHVTVERRDNRDNNVRSTSDNDRRGNWNRHDRDNDRRGNWNRNNNNRRFDSRDWRGWHGDRDIRQFRTRDYSSWRRGHWYHGHHNGRDGWFWIVGDIFYPYAARTAVIPDPYVPADIYDEYGYQEGYWYYCADPEGYYPYVSECYVPWRAVQQ